mgnify:CR=1 FL=1
MTIKHLKAIMKLLGEDVKVVTVIDLIENFDLMITPKAVSLVNTKGIREIDIETLEEKFEEVG